jgi:hypothetical protein
MRPIGTGAVQGDFDDVDAVALGEPQPIGVNGEAFRHHHME